MPRKVYPPITMNVMPVYWSYAYINAVLGATLIFAPQWWYGPSWHYFPQLPPNGFWMGLVCVSLSALQLWALRWHPTAFLLSILFGISGYVYFMAGGILIAEGLLGGKGLMEAVFVLPMAGHKFTHSAKLMAYYRAHRDESAHEATAADEIDSS